MVEIWADSHDIRHLLEHPPVAAPGHLCQHEIAKCIVLLTLPNHDTAYVRGSQTFYEIWSKLLAKYMPSIDVKARKLWSRFITLRQSGRPMVEHVNDYMTVRNLLQAIGEQVPDKQLVEKMLNVDRKVTYLRPMLVRAPIAEIVAGLTDGYSYHYQDRQHQNHSGNAVRGRFQHIHPRGQGATGPPAMAEVNAVLGGEERACYNCSKIGHLREDCPELHMEVRNYLKKQAVAAQSRRRGRARNRGRGGPGVAAISVAVMQNMVDSLSGAESVFLPKKWLIDSGSDINICYNYDLFSYIGPSDIEQCMPLGSTPLSVQGKGVVKMCVGNCMDRNCLSHPVGLEIENVYWVPYSSINVLATPEINTQNNFLSTGPRGNELIMPGFANQKLGKFFDCEQEVDNAGSPVLVFILGKGRSIMRSHPVDNGLTRTDVTDVLNNDTAVREIAAAQQPEGMDYASTAFLAHLAYRHCGDAAMRLIARASELYLGALSSGQAVGLRVNCEGCQLAGNIKRNQGSHQGRLVGRARAPGESLHADVAGPTVPMDIGQAKYVLVAVDELTGFAWVFPMRKKSEAAQLLALLIQRINTQVRQPGEPGVRRLHSDQGGEFKSYSQEEFCQWKGIVHTFTDRAQHEFNGLVERKIGQLNESTRAALLASDVPAYLWPEVYMAKCHTQNMVPSSALQRELKKKEQRGRELDGGLGSGSGGDAWLNPTTGEMDLDSAWARRQRSGYQ